MPPVSPSTKPLSRPGTETHTWYKHHIEVVYCVGGEGKIEYLKSGKVHPIKDGTLYLLNNHDEHLLRGFSEMRLICAFNPLVTGRQHRHLLLIPKVSSGPRCATPIEA